MVRGLGGFIPPNPWFTLSLARMTSSDRWIINITAEEKDNDLASCVMMDTR